MCHMVVPCLTNTVLKFIFIFSDRKAGGSAVPPCLLGTCCGTGCILLRVRSRSERRAVRTEDRTRSKTGVRCGTRDRVRARHGERNRGPRLRTDPVLDPRTEPAPWSSCRAALHTGWWIRIFYLNRTVFPVRGRNRLVHSVSWSSTSSSESDPKSA
jgi:hypothetical protein